MKKEDESNEISFKSKNIIEAMGNALRGIAYTLKLEKNIKIQLVFAILAVILAIILKSELIEIVCLMLTIGIVIFAEMVNTAIETAVDLVTQKYNVKAKIAKDVAAGAVLISAINSIVIGSLIFIPKIIELI